MATSVSTTLLSLLSLFTWPLCKARQVPLPAVLSLLLIVPQVLVGCQTTEHFFDLTGDLFVLSAADHYEEALHRATEWSTDAYLSGIMVHPWASKDGGREPLLLYQFDSPTGGGSFYSVEFDGEAWISRVTEQSLSAIRPPPIDRGDWSLDSVDAWSIALANGGEEFLGHYQDPMTAMSVTLDYLDYWGEDYWGTGKGRGRLAWRVDYFIVLGASLDMFIDPHTGDIIESEERSMLGTLVAATPTPPPTP